MPIKEKKRCLRKLMKHIKYFLQKTQEQNMIYPKINHNLTKHTPEIHIIEIRIIINKHIEDIKGNKGGKTKNIDKMS